MLNLEEDFYFIFFKLNSETFLWMQQVLHQHEDGSSKNLTQEFGYKKK